MFECRYSSCNVEFESKKARGIHESHKHGDVKTGEWDDKAFLRENYVNEGKPIERIADENDAPYNRVRDRIKDYGIETRGRNETRYFDMRQKLQDDKDEIIQQYTEQRKPLYKLADEYEVDDATLKRHIQNWGVDTRDISEQLEKSNAKKYDIITDKEAMRKMYVKNKMSVRRIANVTGRSIPVVSKWLRKHGFEVRDKLTASKIAQRKANIKTAKDGYEFIRCDGKAIRHHRLIATLLVDEISKLKEKHVHHETPIEWYNTLENLRILDAGEHLAHHNKLNSFRLGES